MTGRSHSERRLSRLQIIGTAVGVVAMVLAALVALPARGDHLGLSGSDFESVDGNQSVDNVDHIDWENVGFASKDDKPSGKNDDAFGQGSKEDTACPTVVNGTIPPNKSDLTEFGLYVEDGEFLHMFWERVQDPEGTTNMDFEFNQAEGDCSNGVTPPRTIGDLLITYNLSKGGTVPVFFVHRWVDSGTCEASNSFPCWSEAQALGADATGSVNTATIDDFDNTGTKTGTLDPFTFGEGSVRLSAVFPEGQCTNFGSAYLKSRSSDEFNSALKDFIAPLDFELQNCGTITIIKDAQPDDEQDFTFNTVDGPSDLPDTFTLEDDGDEDDGQASSITFPNLLEGTYEVSEVVPTGWDLSDLTCSDPDDGTTTSGDTATIDLDATETVTCTFTNVKQTGALRILKKSTKSGNPLVANAGAVFSYNSSSVTDNGTDDESDTVGEICVSGLDVGDYTVNETSPPPGYGGANQTDVTATVVAGTNCTDNQPSDADSAEFTNAPLADIQVNYRDGGSGETSLTSIDCDGLGDSPDQLDGTAASGWDASVTHEDIEAPTTITCTIEIDP